MNRVEATRLALVAWRDGRQAGQDHAAACAAATRALLAAGLGRWTTLGIAGALARARPQVVEETTSLSPTLSPIRRGARGRVWTAEAGQEVPLWDRAGRRSRGAFDTPQPMATRLVGATLAAAPQPVRRGLDPACGTGAFLLALDEAGVEEIVGVDRDPVALAVAGALVPRARLIEGDALAEDPPRADVVVGNPPFVPPERQLKALRKRLTRRFAWLRGRYDLAVPFSEVVREATRPGGALGLVLPASMLSQPYGLTWRRRWLADHRFAAIGDPQPFPGASVEVVEVVVVPGEGPATLPGGLAAARVLALPASPLDPDIDVDDLDLVARIRARSVTLGDLAYVDTGLVAHGPRGGKARLMRDGPGPGVVPFVDARDLFTGTTRWLSYESAEMHRPKSPALFEVSKILVQRLRGRGPVRARVDRSGLYAGHTLLVARPEPDCPIGLSALLEAVRSPLGQAVTRVERGRRLDLYPEDLRCLPVPRDWLDGVESTLVESWGLEPREEARLLRLAAF